MVPSESSGVLKTLKKRKKRRNLRRNVGGRSMNETY